MILARNAWKGRSKKVECDHATGNTETLCYDMQFNKDHYKNIQKFERDFNDLIDLCVTTIAQKQIDNTELKPAETYLKHQQISFTLFMGNAENKMILKQYPYMDPYTLMSEIRFEIHLNLAHRVGSPMAFLKEVLHKGLHFRFQFKQL